MGLPLYMLKRLQHIPPAQKIGLASLFSIATIVIICDVLRVIYGLGAGVVALATVWDILEPSIAVMISALPTYRALFTTARKRGRTSYLIVARDSHTKHVQQPGLELNTITILSNSADGRENHDTSHTTQSTIQGV